MLMAIIHHTPALITFIFLLQLGLSKPQRDHVLNAIAGLIVGQGRKTLSDLCRLRAGQPDPKALADTFRESPWRAEMIRAPLRRFLVKAIFRLAKATGQTHLVFFSLDDSTAEKGKATRHLEGVDWHHDHVASRPGRPVYKNGLVFILCRLHVGPFSFTVDMRPYLRERTVRRLNRQRPKDERLRFRSKISLARLMLLDLAPLIPDDYQVYVLFDSWYAAARLIKWCRRRHWHVICALRSNRCLNGQQVRLHNQRLRHKRYTRVTCTAADEKRTRTYLVRCLSGTLNKVPGEVCVFISKRHRGDSKPRYFMSTDTSLSAHTALIWYQKRWPCEVANLYLKTRLGFGDFRVRSFEAIEKFLVVSWLALAFLEWRLATSQQARFKTVADVIRHERHTHTRQTLRAACDLAIQTGDVDAVLERFAPALT
jgi:hypothetical protein